MNTERFSESKPVLALTAAQGTLASATTTLGEAIDTKGYRSLTIPLDIDITTGEIASIGFQESSDDGVADAYAAIDDSEVLYYPDDFPVDADKVVHVGCVAKERYVKLSIVTTGTVAIAIPKSLALLQDALTKPERKESSVIADADVISPDQTADAVTTPPKRT